MIILSVLSACGAPKPRSLAWVNNTTVEEQNAYYRSLCQGYGHAIGTTQMAECIAAESRSVQERASATKNSIIFGPTNPVWKYTK